MFTTFGAPPPGPTFEHAVDASAPTAPDGDTRVVLYIEDNADHAVLVRVAAGRVDPSLDVRVVTSGEDALAYLEGRGAFESRVDHPKPSLLILDLLLPGLGGFDVLTSLADRPELAGGVPVVVLTSSMNPGDRGKAMELGAADFHSKPPDVVELGEVVRGILEVWLP